VTHTVEKIGGTSMSDYDAIRDNIFCRDKQGIYQRIFVVSAYAGVTNQLLEHKKSGQPGLYALFTSAEDEQTWRDALKVLRQQLYAINASLFTEPLLLQQANAFIQQRLDDAESVLDNLQELCRHGHFSLDDHLLTIREMLASLGEAHSAWNTVKLLQQEGVNARLVDLSGWQSKDTAPLDQVIKQAFADIDLHRELPIVTGYTHCEEGLMQTFDRGYSEMTFSRIAVITSAAEAIIHKEYHLSSADPAFVGEADIVPIGRTNYDVADQLANLGMEAIHPRAAKGLRQSGIPLRIKNTFEPAHSGTLITSDYVSSMPCVEIIAGRQNLQAVEIFDQDMVGKRDEYEKSLLDIFRRYHARIVSNDSNANTLTYYLDCSLKSVKRIVTACQKIFPDSETDHRKLAIVSAIGSDMQVAGLLSRAVRSLAAAEISIIAMHQSMRQVDMQFIVEQSDYQVAIKSLHAELVESHNYGAAICAA